MPVTQVLKEVTVLEHAWRMLQRGGQQEERTPCSPHQLVWFGLDKCQVPTKATLSLPLFSWTGEKKMMRGQGEITHQLLSRAKQTELGEKKKFNLSPIKPEQDNMK